MKPEKLFEVGQVWQLRDSESRIIVLKIETLRQQNIIHVGQFKSNDCMACLHMPFSTDAFKDSIDILLSTEKEFMFPAEGYNYWKKEFLNGKAGVYGITVGQALLL